MSTNVDPLQRILDANLNRAKEALRVSEDIARFVLADQILCGGLKQCRHAITDLFLKLPINYTDLISARDSKNDVGRNKSIQDKQKLVWCDLFISNMKRAQEALRVIEECSRFYGLRYQVLFQGIRFRLYELEKKGFRKF